MRRDTTALLPCDPDAADPVRWHTASHGGPPETSPAELAALGQHLNRGLGGKAAALHRLAERLNDFLAPRFVGTLTMAVLLIAAACWLA